MTSVQRERVMVAVRAIDDAGRPLPAADLAALAACSERQLARAFREELGITARDYGEAVRTGRVRQLLRERPTIADAFYEAGYGSSRGFYDEAAPRLGMSPREFAGGAAGLTLQWSAVQTDFCGHSRWIVAVASADGLCAARIGVDCNHLMSEITREFPKATLVRDDESLGQVMTALTHLAQGRGDADALPLDVRGTAFQARVWEALVRIPVGETRSYSEVAETIGQPTAVRAVARACATNPVALAVPCHRVVRSDGSLSGYRWGLEIKKSLLEAERQADAEERPSDKPATIRV